MIEIGRRGFITGLVALVASPAVVRVAPLMRISTRHAALYVPINWLTDSVLLDSRMKADLKNHAWPRPLTERYVNINDYDPGYVREWVRRIELEAERSWAKWT